MSNVPKYVVNLDLEPEHRWNNIIDDYKNKFNDILDIIDNMLGYYTSYIVLSLIEYQSHNVFYIRELRAISNKCNIPLGKIILMQLCYELYACCTSLVINDDGKTKHFRTMDWDMQQLKNLTIQVDFVKNNKIIYTATTWAGYVGIMTAVKPGVCTIALNYRRTNNSILTNFYNTMMGSWPVGFLIRHVIETDLSYEQIVKHLSNSSLISPCYLTISGICSGQGIILTRSRYGVDKSHNLTNINHNYIVQTNIDYDKKYDNNVSNIVYSKERIFKVDELMKKYIGIDDLTDLISYFNHWPIINETTVYIVAMEAGSSHSNIISHC